MWLMADYLPEVAELDRRMFPAQGFFFGRDEFFERYEVIRARRDRVD